MHRDHRRPEWCLVATFPLTWYSTHWTKINILFLKWFFEYWPHSLALNFKIWKNWIFFFNFYSKFFFFNSIFRKKMIFLFFSFFFYLKKNWIFFLVQCEFRRWEIESKYEYFIKKTSFNAVVDCSPYFLRFLRLFCLVLESRNVDEYIYPKVLLFFKDSRKKCKWKLEVLLMSKWSKWVAISFK